MSVTAKKNSLAAAKQDFVSNFMGYADEEHFRLDKSFLNSYAGVSPNFGFNGLGEFAFYRTYSRLKDDNTKETFLDCLKRVVEGCYEIQRRHCRRIHIPWDYHKALGSAQEMFQRIWSFKFLPPGRGLWCMGTPFMWERGSASLNNCFGASVGIITAVGVRPIGELAGTTQTLLTSNGEWVDAPIRSFGEQRLWKLTLTRSGVKKIILTTADHRWFAKPSRRASVPADYVPADRVTADRTATGRVVLLQARSLERSHALGDTKYSEVFTSDLQPGMRLQSVFGAGIEGNDGNDDNDDSRGPSWRVKSVEMTDRVEEVYCATVPGKGCFALEDNILTGNCGFCSTEDIDAGPSEPFCFLMDMSMVGVGVGFDTLGAGKVLIRQPKGGGKTTLYERHISLSDHQQWTDPINILVDKSTQSKAGTTVYQVPDSREGWVESVRLLISSFTDHPELGRLEYDYSLVRSAGSPIKGFGGVASGPGNLRRLHEMLRDFLTGMVGRTMSSRDIVDVMNMIGVCVIAGNVRRCLPAGTLIHLDRGLVPIENVLVGDLVLTANGYHAVGENIKQGTQSVTTIKTKMGPFRCTAKHRVAVLTSSNEYEWKKAGELIRGDRLVFVDDTVPGVDTALPGHTNATSHGTQLVIPSLTTDVAWFLGAVHGGGYVHPGRLYNGRRHHGASVMLPVDRDEYHDGIAAKIVAGFSAFGFDNPGEQPGRDNCSKIRVVSGNLASYLYENFKQAGVPLGVPQCVLEGRPETRTAYLAGLLDSHGCTKSSVVVLSSVHYDFVRQVQAVYASLGIQTKFRKNRDATSREQAKWRLLLTGELALTKFSQIIEPHSVKKLRSRNGVAGYDFGYPTKMVTAADIECSGTWSAQAKQMTAGRAAACGVDGGSLVPVEVFEVVDEGIACETYDLSVPGCNEFVAQGLLVHNSSELSLGDIDDLDYTTMKDSVYGLQGDEVGTFYAVTGKFFELKQYKITPAEFCQMYQAVANEEAAKNGSGKQLPPIPEQKLARSVETWNAVNQHRWASNNAVSAKIGSDYSRTSRQTAINGEPGYGWLENMRDYGRMIDGRQPGIDSRVKGVNPCLTGDMRLLTPYGYRSLRELWQEGGRLEFSGHADSPDGQLAKYGHIIVVNQQGYAKATNVYRTSLADVVFRVELSDGSHVDATDNHVFVVESGRQATPAGVETAYRRQTLADLRTGDVLPLHNPYQPNGMSMMLNFGREEHKDYALLSGWVVGDGTVATAGDGRQTVANVACFDSDIDDALPALRRSMLVVCGRYNNSSDQQLDYQGWERQQEHRQKTIRSCVLGRLLVEDGVLPGDKHRVPARIWRGDKQTVAAFLRGFASADGSVQANYDKKCISVRIEQSRRDILDECRLLLSQFGIRSKVLKRRQPSKELMNDGRGGVKLYDKHAGYELIVSGAVNVNHFIVEIGFIQDYKNQAALDFLKSHPGSNDSQSAMFHDVKVKSVTYLGVAETFCLTEPESNTVTVNGILVGNCGEQSLESYELCTLVETFPANHDGPDDYLRTLKFAYLYAKTVTLLPTHNARTNSVMLRNRRIGVGQSGIVQAFAKHGRRTVLRDFCDAGYHEIRRWDNIYSDWMCVGRSIKLTTVKPSGCRPWNALTTTSAGLLTLEELFRLSGHADGDEWCKMPIQISATQDSEARPTTGGVATASSGTITKTYDNGVSDTVIIRLEDNVTVESTPNHMWFVTGRYQRGRKQQPVNEWRRADEITPDDVLDVRAGVYKSNEHWWLLPLHERAVSMRGDKPNKIRYPQFLNPDLCWLLGYMLGDGSQSYAKYRMRYSDTNLFNLHRAQRIVLDQFGLDTKIVPMSRGRKAYVLEVRSKLLWHWLLVNDLLKVGGKLDLIPQCVRSSTHEDIIAFIAGLCDSGGCVVRRSVDQYAIITSHGAAFAKHVQDVALAVGIVFSRSRDTRSCDNRINKSRHGQPVWVLSSTEATDAARFNLFKSHCNKVYEHGDCNLPWSHERDRRSRTLGRVRSVKAGTRQSTYDIEVADSHWYYAGAVKSHNTVSLVAGATPGIHYPEAGTYWRRVRISSTSILVQIYAEAGYHVEPAYNDPMTSIIKFAVDESRVPAVTSVPMWQQVANVVDYQHYWSDNQVSCTIKFKPSEADQIQQVLELNEDKLKTISFLPLEDHGYKQAPYEPCTAKEVADYNASVKPIDFSRWIMEDAMGVKYCDSETCVNM